MRLNKILFVILSLLVAQSALAAESGIYVAGRAGLSAMNFEKGKWHSSLAGDVSYNYNSERRERVLALGAALGYEFEAPCRVEVEYTYRTNFENNKRPTKDGTHNVDMDLTAHSLLLNVYFDIKNSTPFTPYVMGGLGASFLHTDSQEDPLTVGARDYTEEEVTKTRFAWNVGAGVGYALTDRWTLDLMLRYVDLGQAYWKSSVPGIDDADAVGDISATELLLGVRYKF